MTTTYEVIDTTSGYAVRRADGSYAEFLGRTEADEAAAALQSGSAAESDYEWQASE